MLILEIAAGILIAVFVLRFLGHILVGGALLLLVCVIAVFGLVAYDLVQSITTEDWHFSLAVIGAALGLALWLRHRASPESERRFEEWLESLRRQHR